MNRRLTLWLAGVSFLVLGCDAQRATPAALPTEKAPLVSARPRTPSASALDVLLAQQFDIGMGGAGPHGCQDDLSLVSPSPSSGHPLAWVSSSFPVERKVELRLARQTVLCLAGFPENKPVTITVKAGGRGYTTAVKRVAKGHAKDPADNALFDDRTIDVEDVGDHLRQSAYWRFLPSDPARKAIALSGRLNMTASSGKVKSTYAIPLGWEQGATTPDGWEHSRQLVVYGYPAGAHVPIGLYRVGDDLHAVLEREAGRVVMPRSRIAVFTIPRDVFRLVRAEPAAGRESHCLSVPQVQDCVTQPG